MTSQSPRIYLYKITFEEVSYYYYGIHKEKNFNEYYMGSPKTHKWCWDFYTPKKQILQFFDFTDEGWLEAQEVEKRLIKQFFNTDKWCLNESCGGVISLDVLRETGKKLGDIYGNKSKDLGMGFFNLTPEQKSEAGKKGGKKAAITNKKNKTGIYALTPEELSENGKKGGKKGGRITYKLGLGYYTLTPEEKSELGKRNGNRLKELGLGICGLTKEQRIESGGKGGKITSSQKWMCLETGYVSNAGGLSRYQKARGIDTSKRIRIS